MVMSHEPASHRAAACSRGPPTAEGPGPGRAGRPTLATSILHYCLTAKQGACKYTPRTSVATGSCGGLAWCCGQPPGSHRCGQGRVAQRSVKRGGVCRWGPPWVTKPPAAHLLVWAPVFRTTGAASISHVPTHQSRHGGAASLVRNPAVTASRHAGGGATHVHATSWGRRTGTTSMLGARPGPLSLPRRGCVS